MSDHNNSSISDATPASSVTAIPPSVSTPVTPTTPAVETQPDPTPANPTPPPTGQPAPTPPPTPKPGMSGGKIVLIFVGIFFGLIALWAVLSLVTQIFFYQPKEQNQPLSQPSEWEGEDVVNSSTTGTENTSLQLQLPAYADILEKASNLHDRSEWEVRPEMFVAWHKTGLTDRPAYSMRISGQSIVSGQGVADAYKLAKQELKHRLEQQGFYPDDQRVEQYSDDERAYQEFFSNGVDMVELYGQNEFFTLQVNYLGSVQQFEQVETMQADAIDAARYLPDFPLYGGVSGAADEEAQVQVIAHSGIINQTDAVTPVFTDDGIDRYLVGFSVYYGPGYYVYYAVQQHGVTKTVATLYKLDEVNIDHACADLAANTTLAALDKQFLQERFCMSAN